MEMEIGVSLDSLDGRVMFRGEIDDNMTATNCTGAAIIVFSMLFGVHMGLRIAINSRVALRLVFCFLKTSFRLALSMEILERSVACRPLSGSVRLWSHGQMVKHIISAENK